MSAAGKLLERSCHLLDTAEHLIDRSRALVLENLLSRYAFHLGKGPSLGGPIVTPRINPQTNPLSNLWISLENLAGESFSAWLSSSKAISCPLTGI